MTPRLATMVLLALVLPFGTASAQYWGPPPFFGPPAYDEPLSERELARIVMRHGFEIVGRGRYAQGLFRFPAIDPSGRAVSVIVDIDDGAILDVVPRAGAGRATPETPRVIPAPGQATPPRAKPKPKLEPKAPQSVVPSVQSPAAPVTQPRVSVTPPPKTEPQRPNVVPQPQPPTRPDGLIIPIEPQTGTPETPRIVGPAVPDYAKPPMP